MTWPSTQQAISILPSNYSGRNAEKDSDLAQTKVLRPNATSRVVAVQSRVNPYERLRPATRRWPSRLSEHLHLAQRDLHSPTLRRRHF